MSEDAQNGLTAGELAELEGLRAWGKKGKMEPGSVTEARMKELIRISEGGARPAEAAVRWGKEEVKSFYSVKDRFFYEMQSIGEAMGRPVPWEDPIKLGQWFDIARSQGKRKHGPPSGIESRVLEARRDSLRTLGGVVPPHTPPPPLTGKPQSAAQSPENELPLQFDGEASPDQIVSHLRQQVAALQQQQQTLFAAGQHGRAQEKGAELASLRQELRQWELSTGKIRKDDEAHEAEMTRRMAQFAGELWTLLRRDLLSAFPAEDRPLIEEKLNGTAERLPGLITDHFGLASAPPLPAAQAA